MNAFYEVAVILALAVIIGGVGIRLKQPLIISFILVGILVGPSGFAVIAGGGRIELLAEIGIALMLFVVGLKLDLKTARTMGPVSLATGLGQVVFTSVFGFLLALMLGIDLVSAAYVSLALTFSSTIIVIKLLTDKNEIDALHGRIAVGFLIVQDITVVLAMIALLTLHKGGGEESILYSFGVVGAKGAGLLLGIGILMRWILPVIMQKLSVSEELLLLFTIAWAVSLSSLGDVMGFSKEVGAFLAGISLASDPNRETIARRLSSLRDFLLLFFFIDLGSRLDLSILWSQMTHGIIFSLFVLIGNPIIVMLIMGYMGYRKRTGFLAGLTVAHISEFSLILITMGFNLGHISMEVVGLTTLVGVITIGLSTYMILYSGWIYERIFHLLSVFERKDPYRESLQLAVEEVPKVDIILFGLGDYGGNIAMNLLQRQKKVMGVDFDPEVLEKWQKEGLPVFYGDTDDPEIFETLHLDDAHWVISATPDCIKNKSLLKSLRHRKFVGGVVLTAHNIEEAEDFRQAGADVILRPFSDAAELAVDSLTTAMGTFSQNVSWSVSFREILLKPGSVFSGNAIRDIPVRSETGVSIMAVSRAGKSFFDPGPDFRLYPGDRIVLLGEQQNLYLAEKYFAQREFEREGNDEDTFAVLAVEIDENSPWIGHSLAELNFRSDYGATIIGIERDEKRITAPSPAEVLKQNDRLFVAGSKVAVELIRQEQLARML